MWTFRIHAVYSRSRVELGGGEERLQSCPHQLCEKCRLSPGLTLLFFPPLLCSSLAHDQHPRLVFHSPRDQSVLLLGCLLRFTWRRHCSATCCVLLLLVFSSSWIISVAARWSQTPNSSGSSWDFSPSLSNLLPWYSFSRSIVFSPGGVVCVLGEGWAGVEFVKFCELRFYHFCLKL